MEDVEAQVDLKDDTAMRWTAEEIENQLAHALCRSDKRAWSLNCAIMGQRTIDAELTQTSVGALKASYHHAKEKIGYQLTQALNLP